MNGAHPAPAAHKATDRFDFLVQRAQKTGNGRIVACLLGVAGAEPAQPVAIGDMQIQRYLVIALKRVHPTANHHRVDSRMKVRGRRIARVARYIVARARSSGRWACFIDGDGGGAHARQTA